MGVGGGGVTLGNPRGGQNQSLDLRAVAVLLSASVERFDVSSMRCQK